MGRSSSGVVSRSRPISTPTRPLLAGRTSRPACCGRAGQAATARWPSALPASAAGAAGAERAPPLRMGRRRRGAGTRSAAAAGASPCQAPAPARGSAGGQAACCCWYAACCCANSCCCANGACCCSGACCANGCGCGCCRWPRCACQSGANGECGRSQNEPSWGQPSAKGERGAAGALPDTTWYSPGRSSYSCRTVTISGRNKCQGMFRRRAGLAAVAKHGRRRSGGHRTYRQHLHADSQQLWHPTSARCPYRRGWWWRRPHAPAILWLPRRLPDPLLRLRWRRRGPLLLCLPPRLRCALRLRFSPLCSLLRWRQPVIVCIAEVLRVKRYKAPAIACRTNAVGAQREQHVPAERLNGSEGEGRCISCQPSKARTCVQPPCSSQVRPASCHTHVQCLSVLTECQGSASRAAGRSSGPWGR